MSIIACLPVLFSTTTSIPNNDIPSSLRTVDTIAANFFSSALTCWTSSSSGSKILKLELESDLDTS